MSVSVLTVVKPLFLMAIKTVSIAVMNAIFLLALEVSAMKITSNNQIRSDTPSREFTEEKMQKDFEYEVAQMLTKRLVDNGLISEDEAVKVSELNKLNFEPFYKEILD